MVSLMIFGIATVFAQSAEKPPAKVTVSDGPADRRATLPALARSPDLKRDGRITPVVRVFNQCKDAVVNISSTQVVQMQDPLEDLEIFMRRGMFDSPSQRRGSRTFKSQSVGSGVIVHRSGYIVTNAHVVAQTAERKAVFADNSELDAEVVGMDAENDLALLKVQASQPLLEIKMGRSDDLMVGETVVAIGNPLGFQHTCTTGVVSAVDRTLEINDQPAFTGLIQCDASINPGNSGGPLLNVYGELIGVNFAIRGDGQNIGFAIPVDRLLRALPSLLNVERRYRIVTGLTLTPEGEAIVMNSAAGSPAEKAGLLVGDRLLTFNNQPVRSSLDFQIGLLGKKPGENIVLRIVRAGREYQSNLILDEKPKPDGAALVQQRLGMTLEPLDADVAKRLGLRRPTGLFLSKLEAGGPADVAQLKQNDIIMQIERSEVASLDDLGGKLEGVATGNPIRVVALRFSGQSVYRVSTRLAAR